MVTVAWRGNACHGLSGWQRTEREGQGLTRWVGGSWAEKIRAERSSGKEVAREGQERRGWAGTIRRGRQDGDGDGRSRFVGRQGFGSIGLGTSAREGKSYLDPARDDKDSRDGLTGRASDRAAAGWLVGKGKGRRVEARGGKSSRADVGGAGLARVGWGSRADLGRVVKAGEVGGGGVGPSRAAETSRGGGERGRTRHGTSERRGQG